MTNDTWLAILAVVLSVASYVRTLVERYRSPEWRRQRPPQHPREIFGERLMFWGERDGMIIDGRGRPVAWLDSSGKGNHLWRGEP